MRAFAAGLLVTRLAFYHRWLLHIELHLKQAILSIVVINNAYFHCCICCRHRLPHFSISYSPDFRDSIAKTWPASIDDSAARQQWGWAPKFDLQALADDMLTRLAAKYKVQLPPELAAQQQGSGSSSSVVAAGEKPAGAPVAAAV